MFAYISFREGVQHIFTQIWNLHMQNLYAKRYFNIENTLNSDKMHSRTQTRAHTVQCIWHIFESRWQSVIIIKARWISNLANKVWHLQLHPSKYLQWLPALVLITFVVDVLWTCVVTIKTRLVSLQQSILPNLKRNLLKMGHNSVK